MQKESHWNLEATSSETSFSEESTVQRLNTDSSSLRYAPSEISTDAIKVTVPENAVLTPQKDGNLNSLKMEVKEPQSADIEDLGPTTRTEQDITDCNEKMSENVEEQAVAGDKHPDPADKPKLGDSASSDDGSFYTPDDEFPPRDGRESQSRPSQRLRVNSHSPY